MNQFLLRWPGGPPKTEPQAVAEYYVKWLESAPGVLRIWAEVEGFTLRLHTLIKEDPSVERQVHEAELRVLQDLLPDAEVDFTVYEQGDLLPPRVEAAPVLYARPASRPDERTQWWQQGRSKS